MMIELIDPEVRFKPELSRMNEGERKDYLIRYYRQQSERFRHEGSRLERMAALLKRNYDRLNTEFNDMMAEAAFMYNETREAGDPEMSRDEMRAYLMSRHEEGGSVPHAMLRCDQTPAAVHERPGQSGITAGY